MRFLVSVNMFFAGATISNLVHSSAGQPLAWWSTTVAVCVLANTSGVLYLLRRKRLARLAQSRMQLGKLHARLDGDWAADLALSQQSKPSALP